MQDLNTLFVVASLAFVVLVGGAMLAVVVAFAGVALEGTGRLPGLRYLGVGAAMALLYAALLTVFHGAGLYGWTSSLIASALVTGPAFYLQRVYTFGSRGPLGRELAGYLATIASNVPLGAGVVFLLVDVLGLHPFASGLMAAGSVAVFNYAVFSRWVFRQRVAA